PQRSVITRALGTDPDVDVDTFSTPTQAGDLFMLCSDGLTSMVEAEAILEAAEKHRADLQAAAKALTRAPSKGGGEDHIAVARYAVPYADPYLLPLAALLTAIGITEIYRINPDDAFRQGVWIIIAVAVFAGTLLALRRDYRRLESYKYICGLTAIGLLVLPA